MARRPRGVWRGVVPMAPGGLPKNPRNPPIRLAYRLTSLYALTHDSTHAIRKYSYRRRCMRRTPRSRGKSRIRNQASSKVRKNIFRNHSQNVIRRNKQLDSNRRTYVPRRLRRVPIVGRPRIAKCGTDTAYGRHRRDGETPCDKCRKAHAKYQADYRKRRKC